jgi:hypothetical protein
MAELTPEQRRAIEQAKAKAGGKTQLTPEQQSALDAATGREPEQLSTRSAVDQALLSVPGMRPVLELGNAAGRSVTELIDFFGPGAINSALELAGSERRIPTVTGSLESVGALAPTGAYMQPGLGRDIATTAGAALPAALSAPAAMREGLKRFPQAADEFKSTGRRVFESVSSPRPTEEAAAVLGASVLGELGEETGIPGAGIVGGIVGGGAAMPLIKGADRMFASRDDLANMAASLGNVNTQTAAEILARSLRASGMSPEDAINQYRRLGPNALPADVDDSFREILRASMNIDEGIAGQARRTLQGRQIGAGNRISQAMDIISADSLDDYLTRIDQQLRPEITRLYEQAASNPLPLSGRLRTLMEGDNSLGRARASAESRLADRRAAGDKVSHFDIVDETKRVLDDQIGSAIRDGRNNEARNLIRLKNIMVNEADQAIPEYAIARSTYAGRAALDDAAKLGTEFFKTTRRDLIDLTSTMTTPEKTAYALAAKDSILDRIDNTNINRDQINALFGRNGDVAKLRTLFDNQRAFDVFRETMRRESEFALTRRAALSNSTTAAQLARLRQTLEPQGNLRQAASRAISVLVGGAAGVTRETASIVDQLGMAKGSDEYVQGLIRAGDILLASGMEPARLQAILRRGNDDLLRVELQRIKDPRMAGRAAALTGAAATQATEGDQ